MIRIKLEKIKKLIEPGDEWVLEEEELPEYFMVTRISPPMYLDEFKNPERYYAWRIDNPFSINGEMHEKDEYLIFDKIRNDIRTIKHSEFDSEYKAEFTNIFEFEKREKESTYILLIRCKDRKTGKLICTLSTLSEADLLLEDYNGNRDEYTFEEAAKTSKDITILALPIDRMTARIIIESYNMETNESIMRFDVGGFYRKFSYNHSTGLISKLLGQSYRKRHTLVL
ncbi:MAG: hypothetical protein JW765_05220 [Deltaproteobacteria bacterium]|nr:hypothetical protein [Candidatus Zymogenaceae bacterium]